MSMHSFCGLTLVTLHAVAALLPCAAPQTNAPVSFARVGNSVWLEGKDGHTTAAIRQLETRTQFTFLETAHFRLASSLADAPLPLDLGQRRRLQDELELLRSRGYATPTQPRMLDRMLRAHLYALRLERLYEDVSRRFGVCDADFPTAAPRRRDASYLGEGPFFGMRQRFLVVLCENESTLARYCDAFLKRNTNHNGVRHFFREEGCLFFGAAEIGQQASVASDRALNAALAYNLTHNLVDAFRYYWHEMPFWLQEGFAHWQRRQVDDTTDVFTFLPTGLPEKSRPIDWPTSVRARTQLTNFTPLRDVLPWLDDRKIEFGDHMAIWSRVDFILRRHPAAFGKLMHAIKGPEMKGASFTPTAERLLQRQLDALTTVLGWTPEAFDAEWTAFAKETYPRK